jgi:hypothetical protein
MLATLKSKVSVRWWRRLWLPRDVNAWRFTNSRDLYRVSKQNGFWIFREVAERKVKKKMGADPSEPGVFTRAHPQTPLIRIATVSCPYAQISLLEDLDTYTKIRT